MSILGIDIETYSEVDLLKCGVYAYAEHPSFEILLFAYAFDDEETRVVDLKCGERLPPRVLDALSDPAITKAAFNAALKATLVTAGSVRASNMRGGSRSPHLRSTTCVSSSSKA